MLDKSVRYHCHCTGEYRGARHEPAKSRAWCACMLRVFTCFRTYVFACLTCSTYLRARVFGMLTCLRI